MPPQSLTGRLRVAAGVLRGAQLQAEADGRRDVAQAVRELQAVVRLLLDATSRLDRLRESVAAQTDAAESHDAA